MFTVMDQLMSVMMSKTFSDKLKNLREARGMSLRTMAAELTKLGEPTSHTAIARWESTAPSDLSRLPRRSAIAAISKLFNVAPSWLLEDVLIESTSKGTRADKFGDLDLLSDEEFDALLAVKTALLKARQSNRAKMDA
jgi:transcriptional regulator with XRE-family HTH domain